MDLEQLFERMEVAAAALSAFTTNDVRGLDVAGCASTVASLRSLEHTVAVALNAVARRAETLRVETGAGPGADVVAGSDVSARTAAREAERAALLSTAPELDAAFGDGTLGAEHVDVVASTCRHLEPSERDALLAQAPDLVDDAAVVGPDAFARTLRSRVQALRNEQVAEVRFERQQHATRLYKGIDRESGMYWTNTEYDPITGAAVFAALDRATDRLQRQRDTAGQPVQRPHAAAHALAELVTTGRPGRGRPGAEVLVLIDHQTLVDGLHDDSVCETTHGAALPPGEIRQLACNAGVIPVVLGGDSEVLDVGRASRLATKAQRRALRIMHDTCATESCTVRFDDCDIHHVDPWNPIGQTDLDNLLPLCSRHHHRLHQDHATQHRRNGRRTPRQREPIPAGSGARAP